MKPALELLSAVVVSLTCTPCSVMNIDKALHNTMIPGSFVFSITRANILK